LLPEYRPCQLGSDTKDTSIQLEETSMMQLNEKFTQLLGFDSSPASVTARLIEFVHKHAGWTGKVDCCAQSWPRGFVSWNLISTVYNNAPSLRDDEKLDEKFYVEITERRNTRACKTIQVERSINQSLIIETSSRLTFARFI